jgi:hypothetical protein
MHILTALTVVGVALLCGCAHSGQMRSKNVESCVLWLPLCPLAGRVAELGLFDGISALRQFTRTALLCIACAFVSLVSGATSSVPDDRDRQVLETLLLRLLADSEFDMTRVPTNRAVIVLHARTPEKTGFLQSHQIRSDIDNHTLPSGAERDLRKRNTPPNTKPDTDDAVAATFTNLTFRSGIVVADLTDKMGGPRFAAFEKAHPTARGWVEAFLPGYSPDGKRAVVRALVGPWAHGASVTALLEKTGDKWVVKWHYIARYA